MCRLRFLRDTTFPQLAPKMEKTNEAEKALSDADKSPGDAKKAPSDAEKALTLLSAMVVALAPLTALARAVLEVLPADPGAEVPVVLVDVERLVVRAVLATKIRQYLSGCSPSWWL